MCHTSCKPFVFPKRQSAPVLWATAVLCQGEEYLGSAVSVMSSVDSDREVSRSLSVLGGGGGKEARTLIG